MTDFFYHQPFRCLVCGEHSFYAWRFENGIPPAHYIGEPPEKFFSRDYKCSLCRTELSIYTIVDTLDINELLRKDEEWLESLK